MEIWDEVNTAFTGLFGSVQGIFDDTVAEFNESWSEFNATYQRLQKDAPYLINNPALQGEYDTLMGQAQFVIDTAENIKNALNSNNLEALPLVPVAVIAASIAAMSYWITDAITLSMQLEAGIKPQTLAGEAGKMIGLATIIYIIYANSEKLFK